MPHWKLCEYYERLNHLINQFADNFEKVLAEFSIYLYIISRVPHRAHIRPQPAIILLLDINSKDVILWSIILLVLIIPCFVKMSPQMIFYHIKYLHLKDNLLILIYFQFFSTLLFSVLLLSNHHFLDCFGALLLVGNRTVKCSIHELKVKSIFETGWKFYWSCRKSWAEWHSLAAFVLR